MNEKRKVSYEEGLELSKILNSNFFESSAKDKININESFETLASKIYEDLKLIKVTSEDLENRPSFKLKSLVI